MAQLEPAWGAPLRVIGSGGASPHLCLCSECVGRGEVGCVRWREWPQAPEALLRLLSVSGPLAHQDSAAQLRVTSLGTGPS